MNAAVLLPLLALLGTEPAPPAAAATPATAPPQAPRDFDAPPPGTSAEDQALWRAAYDVDIDVPVQRSRATRIQVQANNLTKVIEERVKSGALDAARAEQLSARLVAPWQDSVNLLTGQWPVDPTRVCRYPLMNFESALFVRPPPVEQLSDARRDVKRCVDLAASPLRSMIRSNDAFEAALAEVERELAVATGRPAASSTSAPTPAAQTAR